LKPAAVAVAVAEVEAAEAVAAAEAAVVSHAAVQQQAAASRRGRQLVNRPARQPGNQHARLHHDRKPVSSSLVIKTEIVATVMRDAKIARNIETMHVKIARTTATMHEMTARISLMTNGMITTIIIMIIIMAAQHLWPVWPLELRPVLTTCTRCRAVLP
jgi:hypothetical protein